MKNWIGNHRKTKFFGAVLIAILLASVYRGYFNMKGYCWENGRYFSDEELIRGMLRTGFLNYTKHRAIRKRDIERKIGEKIQTLTDYESVDEFMELNLDCCVIYKSGNVYPNHRSGIHEVSKKWQFMGWALQRVAVNFRIYYFDLRGRKSYISMQGGGWVNSCGKNIPVPLEHFVG